MVGGKRTCQMCRNKFYKTTLISRNMSYWCEPCWIKREKHIAKGNKGNLKVYKPSIVKFTKIPSVNDYLRTKPKSL